jgi:nucleotide-binding universal stress UspA family protein
MSAIRRILCPVDFSEVSTRAFDYAVALARQHGAAVTVLYVAPSPVSDAGPEENGSLVPIDRSARERWAKELRRLTERAAGVHADSVIEEGNVVADVLANAATIRADLIAMGTHGRSGFERWLLGSVADKVLRKASFPILTVSPRCPDPAAEGAFRRILCALDLSASSPTTVAYAVAVARRSGAGARLTLLHVVDDLPQHEIALGRAGFELGAYRRYREEEARTRLAELATAQAAAVETTILVTTGAAWRGVLHAAAEGASDLIVIGAEGGTREGRLGSNVDRVVREAVCPVLTVRGVNHG